MKISARAASVWVAAVVLAMAGIAAGAPKAAKGAMAPPAAPDTASTIRDQVLHKLLNLSYYGVFDDITFQVNGSEVTLYGAVTNEHGFSKKEAAQLVKSIPGVTKVTNHIEILNPSGFDDQIRRATYEAVFGQAGLAKYSMGAPSQIHIIVKSGDVTLDGQVISEEDREAAEIAVKTVPNVFAVHNNIRVVPS